MGLNKVTPLPAHLTDPALFRAWAGIKNHATRPLGVGLADTGTQLVNTAIDDPNAGFPSGLWMHHVNRGLYLYEDAGATLAALADPLGRSFDVTGNGRHFNQTSAGVKGVRSLSGIDLTAVGKGMIGPDLSALATTGFTMLVVEIVSQNLTNTRTLGSTTQNMLVSLGRTAPGPVFLGTGNLLSTTAATIGPGLQSGILVVPPNTTSDPCKYYLNGVDATTAVVPANALAAWGVLTLGFGNGNGESCRSVVNRVAIFNRPASPSEVPDIHLRSVSLGV